MAENKPHKVRIRFPGDLEYIPSIRKFVSDLLQENKFGSKCSFRSEIIIDEICNNAVTHGCKNADSQIEVLCFIYEDRIEFQVKDSGGTDENLKKLRAAVSKKEERPDVETEARAAGMGLEIVRLLSEHVKVEIDDNNLTSIHVVRRREDSPKPEANVTR